MVRGGFQSSPHTQPDHQAMHSEFRRRAAALRTRALLLCAAALVAPLSAAPRRHLFLDPGSIASASGVRLATNPPLRSEVVLVPDREWEQLMISFYTTVREENGTIRLWYICRDRDNRPNVAYAESKDGLHWTKPALGLVEYHGSKDNNLMGIPSLDGAVFRDPRAKPGEEYVYVGHVHGEGVFRYVSPDGLRWRRDDHALLPFRADTQNVVFWDEHYRRYALYLRGWDLADKWENRLRKVVRLTADRLDAPLPLERSGKGDNPERKSDLPRIVDEAPTVLAVDRADPPGTDVYNISAQPYPLDPFWYVGFPSFFLREKNISDGRLEVAFVGSRDGVRWERYDRQPYLRPGLSGSASANMVFVGPGMVVRGDELWLYGTGFRKRHGETTPRGAAADGVIYRHVQRVDGFVSLDFDQGGGRCELRPVVVTGQELRLNVDTAALGRLRVGLLDEHGRPISGFSLEDCDTVRVNSTGASVSWGGRSDLSRLVGREVRFVFDGSAAKLFSFRFEQP
jgi:hypothetical protein